MPFGFTQIVVFIVLDVDTGEIRKARETVTFFLGSSSTQCLIRREWPIVGFCSKLVVGYSGLSIVGAIVPKLAIVTVPGVVTSASGL